MGFSIMVLCISAVLALIPANIAKSKGYSFGLWWFYGWMLFIVAIIHVQFIPDKNRKSENNIEQIQSAADEIKKYKELLDQGIITQEEFETKEQQLLKLI